MLSRYNKSEFNAMYKHELVDLLTQRHKALEQAHAPIGSAFCEIELEWACEISHLQTKLKEKEDLVSRLGRELHESEQKRFQLQRDLQRRIAIITGLSYGVKVLTQDINNNNIKIDED